MKLIISNHFENFRNFRQFTVPVSTATSSESLKGDVSLCTSSVSRRELTLVLTLQRDTTVQYAHTYQFPVHTLIADFYA